MLFVSRVPAPPLDAFIASVWFCENEPGPFALQRVLPSGAAQLIVNLKEDQTRMYHPERSSDIVTTTPGTVLSGISSRYGIIDSAEQEFVAGVAFRPGGTVAFFSPPADELRDADIPLEALWGRSRAAALRERLLEAGSTHAMLDILEQTMSDALQSSAVHPAVSFALDQFADQPGAASIAAVQEQIGLSAKRFIEHFKTSVGLSPKHYCRILRFQSALSRAEQGRGVDWTHIAVDCGYFDQAHFIHDFRGFAGITPTAYDSGRTQFRNHVKFLQSGAAGGMA